MNNNYDLIYDVTAGNGKGLFVALSKDGEIYYMYSGKGNKVQSINVIPSYLNGTYDLYIGATLLIFRVQFLKRLQEQLHNFPIATIRCQATEIKRLTQQRALLQALP